MHEVKCRLTKRADAKSIEALILSFDGLTNEHIVQLYSLLKLIFLSVSCASKGPYATQAI